MSHSGKSLILFVLALTAWPATLIADDSCIECHQSEGFYSTQPKLHRYYQEWSRSMHSESGVGCQDCHGGNPGADNAARAHQGVLESNESASLLHFTNQPKTCGSCHDDKLREFEQSKHYKALTEELGPAPTCTTCHPAMNKRPDYKLILLNACNTCHEAGNERGLPAIGGEAEDVLRHLNMAEGLLGWTTLHYSSRDWPGDSRVTIQGLQTRYDDTISQVHRFDLEHSRESTMLLLDDLRQIFDAEKRASRTAGTAR